MMKPLIVVFFLTFIFGCSSTQEFADLTLPSLVYQYPLPAFTHPVTSPDIRIELNVLIGEDGSVRYVDVLRGSGDLSWDSLAKNAIKQWRYTPAEYKGTRMKLWLHQTAVVQFSQPNYVTLAELFCPTKESADSVYKKLSEGCDFCEMVLLHSVAPSREKKGTIGSVNIQQYPEEIRKMLSRLDTNEWTEPVKYGNWYAIFKRVNEQ